MFAAPEFGWCRIEIGDWKYSGSYLEDYPYTIPSAMIQAVRCYGESDDIEECISSFLIDAEGSGRFTVKFFRNRFEVWEEEGFPEMGDQLVFSASLTQADLNEMALESARDLSMWLSEWCCNWAFIDEDDNGSPTEAGREEISQRREEFDSLISEILMLCA